jgi:predicted nuclease of restriction endonuclease-like (RecB) superfamily
MKGKRKEPKLRNSSLEDSQARIPTAPGVSDLPADYASLLTQLKQRIREERLRVVMTANAAMVLLYWDIGCAILGRQQREGWGARVIDRLSADLRREFPDMQGLSPRNLKYMRAFAAAWPNRQIVQQVAAQIPWFHNCVLLDKVADPEARLWYARKVREEGWSRNMLVMQIERRLHERQGKVGAVREPPLLDVTNSINLEQAGYGL